MLLDANILLYARNAADRRHGRARAWLEDVLNGPTRVGLPWPSLTAFVRIATHPRVFPTPLSPADASDQVGEWLEASSAWIPVPTDGHVVIFTDLVRRHRVIGSLVTDAHLAALAVEHGVAVATTDADFARFREVRSFDPLR